MTAGARAALVAARDAAVMADGYRDAAERAYLDAMDAHGLNSWPALAAATELVGATMDADRAHAAHREARALSLVPSDPFAGL